MLKNDDKKRKMVVTRRSWHLQSSKFAPRNSNYMSEKILIVPRLPKRQKYVFEEIRRPLRGYKAVRVPLEFPSLPSPSLGPGLSVSGRNSLNPGENSCGPGRNSLNPGKNSCDPGGNS